jgi:alkylation response protein AidB-like acyl-CoA dehydrogenase
MSTTEALLAAVEGIKPSIRQHAAQADRDRRLATPVVKAMRDAGLYRLWRPKALGGLEVEPVAAFRILEEVACIDSAAGWNLQLSTGFDILGPWYEDSAAKEIFGGDAILGGAFNPMRKAIPVDGGYRVSGRTPFVSGAHQDTFFFGLANIFDDGAMRLGPNGIPETLLTACPSHEAEIVDNWNTMGMCGTGSHDVNLQDVFIPQTRAVPWVPLGHPGSAYTGPLYRLTIWPAVAALAPPALGIARAAIEETIELGMKKTPAYTARTLKDRAVVQSQLAQAEAKLGASRAYLYEVFEEAWEEAVAARPITMKLKARMQLASTNAILESAEAVDLTHAIVGTSGFREEFAFSRHFRDVHVITQHGFINASKLESVGQIMLGLEPEWPFFSF